MLVADVLADPEILQNTAKSDVSGRIDMVFIDINGNRPLMHVRQAVQLVQESLRPRMIVVKSVHLAEAIDPSCRSSKQMKRQLRRQNTVEENKR